MIMDFKSNFPEGNINDVDQIIDAPEGDNAVESIPDDQRPAVDWASSAARYEWQDSYGDVAPKLPDLEILLFGDRELRGNTGLDFEGLVFYPFVPVRSRFPKLTRVIVS